MKVLVTGASGRIGAHVVLELLGAGHTVRGGIRTGSPRAGKLSGFDVEVAEADLLDRAALARAVDGVEAVIHNGVIFTSDPATMIAGSLEATATLLEAARKQGCARFIFISSTSVYEGTSYRPGDPIREEEAAPEITNVYGACKLAGEALCNSYYLQHGLPTCSLRFPMVTAGAELLNFGFLLETWTGRTDSGPAEWRNEVKQAWDSGKKIAIPLNSDGSAWKRHFCDVRDAARAVHLALEAEEAMGRAYNIASTPMRYEQAAGVLEYLTNWESARIPFPDQYRYEFALNRAAEFLAFRPEQGPRDMVTDAWKMREGKSVPGLIAP